MAGLNNTSVKVLLEGMQVLARLRQPPAPRKQPGHTDRSPPALTGQQEIADPGRTPQQAEVVKFAQLQGSISLVLRSSQDFFDENGEPIPAPAGRRPA